MNKTLDKSKESRILQHLQEDLGNEFKYSQIQGDFGTDFWSLWKEQKDDPNSALRKEFPDGKVWKHPTKDEWRFYFNTGKD